MKRALLGAVAIFALGGTARAEGLSVTLYEEASPAGGFVKLSDVAGLGGGTALARRAGSILLGRTPGQGELRSITREYVARRLAAENIETVSFEGPGRTLLRPREVEALAGAVPAARVTSDRRRNALDSLSSADKAVLASQLAGLAASASGFAPGDMEVDITGLKLTGRPEAGTLRVTGMLTRSPLGVVRATVAGTYGEAIRPAGTLTADVSALRRVLAPVRRIEQGEVLQADDLKFITVGVRNLDEPFVLDPSRVTGKEVSRAAVPGRPITMTSLRNPKLVIRGEAVTVVSKSGFLSITDRGIARGDGVMGGVVQVENLRSSRIFEAVVTGPRTVRPVVADEMVSLGGKGDR